MSRSVRIIGWSTVIFSIIIILSEFSNLFSDPIEQLNAVFQMFPQAKSRMETVTEVMQYDRIWSVYTILYFWFVFFGSIQFLRFRSTGRMILEIACWIGMVNACIDSILSYVLWKQMQTALSSVTGAFGMGLESLNPLGSAAIILSFFMWIIPTLGMVFYLRKPTLKALMK